MRSGFSFYGLIYLWMHRIVILFHLHCQVVRVYRDEILFSEREPVQLNYSEVVLILDAFVFLQVRVLVKALPAQMALSCIVLDKDADEYTRLLCFVFLLFLDCTRAADRNFTSLVTVHLSTVQKLAAAIRYHH